MNILHICSDYPFTPIYQQLLTHSAPFAHNHIMYVPLSYTRQIDHQHDCNSESIEVIYSRDFHDIERFFYNCKRRKILNKIKERVVLDSINIIHAHHLFSAGGVAYELKKTHGIDYIVAVRNTDINTFFKKAFHLRNTGIKILTSASRIIFLSPASMHEVLSKYVPVEVRDAVLAKSITVPNGIDDYWLSNNVARKRLCSNEKIKLIYVGEFSKNKNIERSISAVKLLADRGYNVELKLVGGKGIENNIYRLADKYKWLEVYDRISNKDHLLKHYMDSHIFIMPSITETFGLVYIEAMSQGLPLIYTKGQGIDGYFMDGHIGYACNPFDISEIANRVEDIICNYNAMSARCLQSLESFSWDRIAKIYEKLYLEIS